MVKSSGMLMFGAMAEDGVVDEKDSPRQWWWRPWAVTAICAHSVSDDRTHLKRSESINLDTARSAETNYDGDGDEVVRLKREKKKTEMKRMRTEIERWMEKAEERDGMMGWRRRE